MMKMTTIQAVQWMNRMTQAYHHRSVYTKYIQFICGFFPQLVGKLNSLNFSKLQVMLTPQEEEEWRDVIKMNDYLAKGRRPQFWEETFTKRVMEAIKSKELEMKKAAQLLGVSYGTLYGRYRETYGCLKHPYR